MSNKKAWLWAGIGAAAIAYGCGGGQTGSGPGAEDEYGLSVQRMKALTTAMLAYTGDHDDMYPPANRWMDATTPYVQVENAFVSPAVQGDPAVYGYAFNSVLAGRSTSEVEKPEDTILLFDSTVLSRNATAPISTMPSPPRYATRNTTSYADGWVPGWLGSEPTDTPGEVAANRLRRVATGLVMYAADYDDHLPLASDWVDSTLPYVKSERNYRTPALEGDPNAFGFALNADVAGKSLVEFESIATTLGLFDSTNVARNATALPTTRPNPPRYTEGNAQAFLDGHVVLAP